MDEVAVNYTWLRNITNRSFNETDHIGLGERLSEAGVYEDAKHLFSFLLVGDLPSYIPS